MAKITVIGSFVVDQVARMEAFPKPGETVIGNSIETFLGGKGINQCVSVSRLGGNAEMIGMLGNDEYGMKFRKLLFEEGIKSDFVFDCDKPTAMAQIQINCEGQNRICVIPSANHVFGSEHLEKVDSVIKQSDLLILQLEMQLDVTKEIIRRAHAYGVKILLNPAPAVKLERDILKQIDYITPNENELALLTGMPTKTDEQIVAAAKELLSYGTKTVVATLGERGALIADEQNTVFVPGYQVNAVDTVAAGDSFNGALAVALTEGRSLWEAVSFANAMGALTVQKMGASPSLHTRKEVEDFIISHH